MENLLIVGVDTVVGANIAATLADRRRVFTLAAERGFEIPNCAALDPEDAPRKSVEKAAPEIIVLCGASARSNWEPQTSSFIRDTLVGDCRLWAQLAQETGAKLVMVSSDAVFTGPWMFHVEESSALCKSYQAQVIRAAEAQVTEECENSLILRTNAFGWSPRGNKGWLETMLLEIGNRRVVEQDYIRHATPILASDLAEILDRACQENLTGIYHAAGAERLCPLAFAQRLADTFDLPWLAIRKEAALTEPPQGFGEGECSLQTKKIRKALCVAMPLLSEGLHRLREQSENGYRDRLASGKTHRVAAPVRKAA